jgi:hypothetical protein
LALKSAKISSPLGETWVVSREWVKGPKVRWGVRRKPRAKDLDFIDVSPFDFIDSLTGIAIMLAIAAGIVIAGFLTAFVILPLIGFAVEFAIALVLLAYGLIARVLFRRPWVIHAKNLDKPSSSRDFKVVGWQRSREAIAGIEQLIASGADLDSPSAASFTG